MKTERKPAGTKKPKKVTVKFFVNKSLLPQKEGKIRRYPLYTLITYDRKNTMLRCFYGKYYKNLEEIENVSYPGLLAMEDRLIRKTIQLEMERLGDKFDLKGVHKKYERFAVGIHTLLEDHLKGNLWSAALLQEPFEYGKALNFTDPDVSFDTLFAIAEKLYQNLERMLPKDFRQDIEMYRAFMKIYGGSFFQYDFPCVIEWLDDSKRVELKKRFSEEFPGNTSLINRSTDLIDRLVKSYLKSTV